MSFTQPLEHVRITQRFGENPQIYKQFGLAGHNGLDYGCPVGTPLLAVDAGTVVEVGNQGSSGYGKFIRIKTVGGYEVTYGHMSRIDCQRGQEVRQGQVLGASGNTGFSTGPHLHLGVRQYDKQGNIANYNNGYKGAIDPLPFFTMDEELDKAKAWAEANNIMQLTNLDKPMLRQDVLRVLYRLFRLLRS